MNRPTILDVRNAIYDVLKSKFGVDGFDMNSDVTAREFGSIVTWLPDGSPVNVRVFIGKDTPEDHQLIGKLHFGFDPVIYGEAGSAS